MKGMPKCWAKTKMDTIFRQINLN
uniref:Uncharacterized protein n=1 Tax=Arundo donax TaxID=35708 RepID=A0A0A9HDY8_ARUDO